jgi:4-hydroxyphenylpyruvate dioxygenase
MQALGVRLALEFRLCSPLDNVAQTLRLCERVGFTRARVLVDSFHAIVGQQLAEVANLPCEAIGLVQFCDAPLPRPGTDLVDASLHGRVLPGDGDLDLTAFVNAIASTGYTGVVSPEILSPTVRQTPPAEFASELLSRSVNVWQTHLTP